MLIFGLISLIFAVVRYNSLVSQVLVASGQGDTQLIVSAVGGIACTVYGVLNVFARVDLVAELTKSPTGQFVFRWIVTTVAAMVASSLLRGIRYDSPGSLIAAALLLGILNAFVRPVLLILSAPLILLTLGLFILVVNGLMLLWVPTLVSGFHVDGFGSAFWGAIIIGIVSWLLSAFFRGSDGRVHVLTHHTQMRRVQGRVIDPNEK